MKYELMIFIFQPLIYGLLVGALGIGVFYSEGNVYLFSLIGVLILLLMDYYLFLERNKEVQE